MEYLKVKTRAGTDPEELPAVHVSCHPADAGRTLDSICSALLEVWNCAVYWTEDMTSPVPDAELSRMNLFIFPVSSRFLNEPNRAADADLPFAAEHRIPVLPVLTEPGLEGSIPLQEKFGRLQCLSCLPVPPEELTFQEALTLYLDSVLFSDALVRRIQDAAEAGTLQADSTDPEGMYLSGLACLYGISAEPDRSRALELITRAAEAGLPEAMGTLAAMYRTGNGAPVDFTAAVNWQISYAGAVEDRQGSDSPEAVTARYRLFEYCRDFGRRSEAEAFLLGTRQDTDESTLSAMALLAFQLNDSGKYRDALVLAKQAYACIREFCPADERSAVDCLGAIGSYCMSAGEYEKSRDLLERALKGETALLGEKDPYTLGIMATLGLTYLYLRDAAKAKDMLTRAAAGRGEVLGEENPSTLVTLSNLATAYGYSGDFETAEEILGNVLAVQRRTLGDRDPGTLNTKYRFAMLCRWSGESAEARKLLTEVLEVSQEVLGPHHPDTVSIMSAIAACCIDEGDCRQARQMLEKTVALDREILGASHPETLDAVKDLAVACFLDGEKEKALKMLRGVLADLRRTLGEKHPSTLDIMFTLGLLYSRAGLNSEAAAILEQTAAGRIEVLGRDHPETLETLKTLERVRRTSSKPPKKHSSRKKKRG